MSPQLSALWIEFEQWQDAPPRTRDFFNMKISLQDGREYALNVWTFAYAEQVRDELREERSSPIFVLGPDLMIDVADRPTLEAVAERLIREQLLREEWLVPRSMTSLYV